MSLLALGAERLGRALLELDTEDSKLMKGIDRAGAKAKKALEGHAADFAKIGAAMSLVVTGPLALFGSSSLKAFQEQEKATAAVTAALKSMGPVAGFTANELQRMAEGLQATSTFADDEILSKVTANLLTFGNISGDVFARAQQAAVDLSARLGTDLQGSAIMLGKALNDPLHGLTALMRVGVAFSAEQKELIKDMVGVGDAAGAQALILSELERQYGGQAAAMAATTSGQMKQLSNSWNDFQEVLGQVIAQVLPPLTEALRGLVSWLQSLDQDTIKWIVTIGGIVAAVGPVIMVVGGLVAGIGALIPVLTAVGAGIMALIVASGPIGLFIAAAGLLTLAWLKWGEDAQLLFTDAFEAIALGIEQLKLYVTTAFTAITDVMTMPFRKMVEAGQWAYNMLVGQSIIPDMVLGIDQWLGYLESSTASHMGSVTDIVVTSAESQRDISIDSWQSMFSAFGQISHETFMVAQAIGAGQAFVSALVGAAKALELPYPYNLFAAASVLATGLTFVARIKAATSKKPSTSVAIPARASGAGATAPVPAEAGAAAGAAQQATPLPSAGQTLTVQGLGPDELWSGKMVRAFAEKIIEFQRNGGRVVLEG